MYNEIWDLPENYKSVIYDEANFILNNLSKANTVQIASDKLPILYIVASDTVVVQLIILGKYYRFSFKKNEIGGIL